MKRRMRTKTQDAAVRFSVLVSFDRSALGFCRVSWFTVRPSVCLALVLAGTRPTSSAAVPTQNASAEKKAVQQENSQAELSLS